MSIPSRASVTAPENGRGTGGDDNRSYRIVVAHTETFVREALCDLLLDDEDVSSVVAVAGVEELISAARRVHPHAVVTDVYLADGDVGTAIARLRDHGHRCGVVVMTRFPAAGVAAAGAYVCLDLDVPRSTAVAAVKAAARGRPWHGVGAAVEVRPGLNPLETRILAELASGATNREIAARLGYSDYYIKDLVLAIRRRLDAKDRSHAAALAVLQGMVRPVSDGRFAPVHCGGDESDAS